MSGFPASSNAFPAPTAGFGFPSSTYAQNPMNGVNPFQPGSGVYQGMAQLPPPSLSAFDQHAFAVAGLDSSGFDPQTGQPTSAAATAQSLQTAIQKLATVNPQLAQEMLQKYSAGGNPTSGGGGFLHDLKHIAGEILAPGLSLGGKLMSLMGRTAHIIPGIFEDMVDHKGGFNPFTDVASALTGHSTYNWNSVFQTMGWKGNGFSGFARALLGTALDVGTDPLTYAMAPLSKGIRGAEAFKAVFSSEESVARLAASRGVPIAGEAGAKAMADMRTELEQLAHATLGSDSAKSRILGASEKALSPEDAASRLGSLFGTGIEERDRTVMSDIMDASTQAYRAATDRTFAKLVRTSGEFQLKDAIGVDGEPIKRAFSLAGVKSDLETAAKGGNWKSASSDEWGAAKSAAGILGGARLRYVVPFTSLRWLGPQLIPASMTGLASGMVARFATGLSGEGVLWKAIAAGRADPADAAMWAHEGYSGITKMAQSTDKVAAAHAQQLLDVTKGRLGNLASAYFSTAEFAGKLTQVINPGARLYRMGVDGYVSQSARLAARDAARALGTAMASGTATDAEGVAKQVGLAQELEKAWGISARTAHNTATVEDHLLVRNYMDLLGGTDAPRLATQAGPETGEIDMSRLKQWFDSSADSRAAQTSGDAGAIARQASRWNTILDTLSQIPEGPKRQILDAHAASEDLGRKTLQRMGVPLGDARRIGTEYSTRIHPDSVPGWRSAGTEAAVNSKPLYLEVPAGVTPDEALLTLQGQGEVAGYGGTVLTDTPTGEVIEPGTAKDITSGGGKRYVRVAFNGTNSAHYYADGLEHTATDNALLDEISQGFQGTTEALQKGVEQQNPVMATQAARQAGETSNRAMLWDALDARGNNEPFDHIIQHGPDGEVRIVARNAHDVRILDNAAELDQTNHGFWHRTLTDEAKAHLATHNLNEDHVAAVTATLTRSLGHMTTAEAEAHLKEGLFSGFGGQVFKTNLLEVHNSYVRKLGYAMQGHMMGEMADHLRLLKDLVPHQFGYGVGSLTGKPLFAIEGMSRVAMTDAKTMNAIVNLTKAMNGELGASTSAHQRVLDSISELLVQARQGVGPANDSEFSKVVEGLADTHQRFLDAQAADTARIDARIAAHGKQLDRAARVVGELVGPDNGSVELRGQLLDRSNTAVGDIPAEQVEWVKTSDLKDYHFPRNLDTREQGQPYTDADIAHYRAEIKAGRFPKPIEMLSGAPESSVATEAGAAGESKILMNDGNHVYEAAVEAGREYVPVRHVVPAELPEGLSTTQQFQLRARMADPYAGRPLSEAFPDKFHAPPGGAGHDPDVVDRLLREGRISINSDKPGGQIFIDDSPEAASRLGRWTVKHPDDINQAIADLQQQKADLHLSAEQRDLQFGTKRTSTEVLGDAADKSRRTISDQTGKSAGDIAKEAKRAQRIARRVGIATERARQELNRAIHNSTEAINGAKVAMVNDPAAAREAGYVMLEVPGLTKPVYAHPYLAEEINSFFKNKAPGDLKRLYREHMLGPWKRWSTYRNPGFQFKHNIGRWFINTIGGVTASDYELSRIMSLVTTDKAWADKPLDPAIWDRLSFGKVNSLTGLGPKTLEDGTRVGGAFTYGDLGELAANHGIGRANSYAIAFAHEAGQEAASPLGRGRWAMDKLQAVDGKLRDVTTTIDDFHRQAAWLAGLRHTGGDFYGARVFTMMRQGDFGDMTHGEKNIADLLPFYKWMRTSIPMEFKQLAENPAGMMLAGKVSRGAFEAAGFDYQKYQQSLPSYMRAGFDLPNPFAKQDKATGGVAHLSFDLPYAELHKGLKDYLSSSIPLARNLIESYATKQNLYTGAPLGGKMVPLGAPFNLPGLRNILSATGLVKMGVDGKTPYIPDTLDNVLQAVPLYTRFKDWITADPTRSASRFSAFLAWSTAFRYQTTVQAAHNLTAQEQAFYFDEMVPLLSNLKSMGFKFPTAAALHTTLNGLVNNATPATLPSGPGGLLGTFPTPT